MKVPFLYRIFLEKKYKTFQIVFFITLLLSMIAGIVTSIVCLNTEVTTADEFWRIAKWIVGVNGAWIGMLVWVSNAVLYRKNKEARGMYICRGQIFW